MSLTLDFLPDELYKVAGSVAPPRHEARHLKSVIIVGYARTGKTLLAEKLHKEKGFTLVSLDVMNAELGLVNLNQREAFLRLLLKLYPYGLVVEGDNLFGENQSGSSLNSPEEFRRTVRRLIDNGIKVIFVGNAATDVEHKTAALLRFREEYDCWTSYRNYERPQLENIASRSIKYSIELRGHADQLGVPYLDLRPQYFQNDFDTGLSDLLSQLE